RFSDDERSVGTNQFNGAGDNSFWTLSVLAHYQHWLSKRRRFFLDSYRVSQDDGCPSLKLSELIVWQGIGDDYVFRILNLWKDRLTHCRVQVKRKREVDVWILGREVLNRTTDFFHGIKVLSAVSRHNDYPLFRSSSFLKLWICEGGIPACSFQECVNYRVTGDNNVLRAEAFNAEILKVTFSRR